MQENDMKLKLLRGSPIKIDNVGFIYPLTLGEIDDIGELQYNKYIFATTLNKKLLDNDIPSFELIVSLCLEDDSFKSMFLDSLKIFFREEVYFHKSGFFYLGDASQKKVINSSNYNEIVGVIKKQNFINDKKEEEETTIFYDEASKKIHEQMQKFKQKIKEQNQEKGLDMSDILSIVACHSTNINIHTIWDWTVFQVYTAYIRLMMKEKYDSQFAILLQGVDAKELDLKHWASKILE